MTILDDVRAPGWVRPADPSPATFVAHRARPLHAVPAYRRPSLIDRLVRDLPRKDQRRVAAQYVAALLCTQGRKTARSMVSESGTTAGEQRLNHFITGSTWDWRVVARRIRDEVFAQARPTALVIDEMIIPKSGRHTVGVSDVFHRASGRTVRGQRAFGAWAVDVDGAAPLSWRLHMPPEWCGSPVSGSRAACHRQPVEAAIEVLADVLGDDAAGNDLGDVPVIADLRDLEPAPLLKELLRRDHPFAVRISGRLAVRCVEPLLYTWMGKRVEAGRIAAARAGIRRPVRHPALRAAGTTLIAAADVTLLEGGGDMCLLTTLAGSRSQEAGLWLTNITPPRREEVLLRTCALDAVAGARENRSAQLGLCDYSGRSYDGWHRHMTLVAAAHCLPGGPADHPGPIVDPTDHQGRASGLARSA